MNAFLRDNNTLPTARPLLSHTLDPRLSCFLCLCLVLSSGRTSQTRHTQEAHHDVFVDEAPPIPSWFEMRIFFSAGDFNIPNLLPGLIKLNVYRVDSGVVGGHCVAHVSRNAMLLRPSKLSLEYEEKAGPFALPPF